MFMSECASNYYVKFSKKVKKKEYVNYSFNNQCLRDKSYITLNAEPTFTQEENIKAGLA